MPMLLNPSYKPHLALVADDDEWDALKLIITNYLQANADAAEVDVATVRALDAKFADDGIWAQISADLELFGVGVPE